MRISDWSSDVCSSDLTGPVTGFVRKGSGPTSLRLSGLGLLHQGLEGIGLTHRQVRQHLAVELDTSPPDAVHKLGVGQAVLAGAGVDALDPQGAERSEEHTSELQSLMRISYAVFCLKKKKQNNTSTIER